MLIKRALLVLNIMACCALISLAAKFVVWPSVAKMVYKNNYQELMFQCDNVMREHLIAKNRVIIEKSEQSLLQLDAAEMGLVTCHDYDVLRKKMRQAGVSDHELSLMGLEVIEAKARNLHEFVDIHETKH